MFLSESVAMSCCKGPGYASPEDAFRNGARERLLYIPCIVPSKSRPDYLVTIDCDPWSETYSQVGNCNIISNTQYTSVTVTSV